MIQFRSSFLPLGPRRQRVRRREWFSYFGSFGDDFFTDD